MPTATASVLFTDVEGSTELRSRLGEAAADQLFLEHERLLRRVVERQRGRVVKTAGDGIMAAFDSASDAVAAAVQLQQAVARQARDLRIRVGVAAGDVSWEDGDCFGLPVVTAARLEAAAQGGQILVSQVVRWLAGDRAEATFAEVGSLDLKGLPGPVDAFEVAWEPSDGEAVVGPVPLPAVLGAEPGFAFVGRDDEWATMARAWASALAGTRAVVLLGGEAGAGKTRLAAEFARRAHAEDGAAVFFGGCDPDLVIPYQAWVQVLEQVLRHLPPEDIEPSIAVDLSVLGPLLPNLPHVGSRPPATLQGVDVERLRLFSAVDVLLAAVGRRWPSIVVLDDLHWGGPQTLSLLAHIARPSSTAPLLVLGTFRDTGDEITDQLAATLADLRRLDSVDRLRVAGLRDEDVAAFVAGAAGRDLDAALAKLAATVAERSRGNAFYVGELWRHLVATGAVVRSDLGWTVHPDVVDTAVPESVREVVVDRLARLAPAARRVAELVAVGGPVVELRVLLAAADVPAAEVTTALNELTAFGFLETVERPQLAYQFGHALVRDTIERAIPAASRAQLHLRLGDALESLYEPEWLAARPAMHRRTGAKVVGGRTSDSAVAGVGVLADLFRHYAAAASLGTAAKAVYYGRRAAEQAMQSLAANVATAYLERALELVPLHSQQWAETLVALAEAVVYDNRWAEAERYYEEAFHWARERGDARLAADAALGYEDSVHGEGLPGDAALRMVSEAIRMVGDDGSSLRTRLEAALARSQTHAGRLAEAEITLERALEMARAGEDDEALTIALVAAVVGATDPRRILDRTHELEQLAAQTGNYWTAAYATVFQLRAYTWLGELDRVRELAEHHRALGERLGHVMIVLEALPYEVTLALAEGRLADAEAAADRMLEIGADNWVAAPGMYGLHMFAIRREQGRLGEVLPVLEMMSRGGDADAVWGPGLAALYAELGRLDDARREFDALAPDRFRSIPRDALWPACATFLADVCVALGDKEHADVLYDDVLAFRGGTMMVGHTVSLGPADRLLGGLAALSGRNEAADAHFRVAHDLTDRVKAPAWRAHVDHDWARFRADRGDVESASRLLDAAHATAQRLGLAGLAAKCESLASAERAVAAAPADAYPDGLSAREVDVLKLVAQGCSNREIGERLLISANTAANHVRAILQKTACTNRAEAAAYAARNALID